MIDNFAPQPYPLECSADGETWSLVIGWQKLPDGRLAPTRALPGGPIEQSLTPEQLRYRLTDPRSATLHVQPARAAVPAVQPPRRERRPEAT